MATKLLIMLTNLIGGLVFFLFGMSSMSGGLEQLAGGKLERTLKKVGSNDLLGFSLGAGITVAIQSSSALTVMLVGLVNSGIMLFPDTFGMIMGSHVGTTLTGWMLTLTGISGDNFFLTLLKPTTFAPILGVIGVAMRMISKRDKRRNLGLIFIGFSVLMIGMSMMSSAMADVKDNESFKNILVTFGNAPFLAFAVSTGFTGIIQSSAATVAIVQALALAMIGTKDPMTYQLAIPLVAGANVGTCMTAFISAIGTNKDAKRVVAMHVYSNAIGGILCVALMYVVRAFSPNLMLNAVGIIGVAVIHSLFNIINTVAFVPFKKPLIKLCEKTVKKDNGSKHTVFLDERIFNTPPLAISECRRLAMEMAQYARKSIIEAIDLIENFDEEKSAFVVETENITDKYEDKLSSYLVRISAANLSQNDSRMVGRLLHAIGDFERIGDHALNIRDVAQEIKDKEIIFSKDAIGEIKTTTAAIIEILNLAVDSFIDNDMLKAQKVEPLEQVIDGLKDELKARHVERLQRGECTVKLGFVFTDILTNYERISDHCSNIAVYTLQGNSSEFDSHSYLRDVKSGKSEDFNDMFESYSKKYSVK